MAVPHLIIRVEAVVIPHSEQQYTVESRLASGVEMTESVRRKLASERLNLHTCKVKWFTLRILTPLESKYAAASLVLAINNVRKLNRQPEIVAYLKCGGSYRVGVVPVMHHENGMASVSFSFAATAEEASLTLNKLLSKESLEVMLDLAVASISSIAALTNRELLSRHELVQCFEMSGRLPAIMYRYLRVSLSIPAHALADSPFLPLWRAVMGVIESIDRIRNAYGVTCTPWSRL